jgi:hypothetical protein
MRKFGLAEIEVTFVQSKGAKDCKVFSDLEFRAKYTM